MISKTIGCRGTQHFQTNPFIWGSLSGNHWESGDPHRGGDATSRVRTEGVVELVLVLPGNVEHRATSSNIEQQKKRHRVNPENRFMTLQSHG